MIRVITVLLFFTFHCGSNGSPLLWINQIPKPWEIDEKDFDKYNLKVVKVKNHTQKPGIPNNE